MLIQASVPPSTFVNNAALGGAIIALTMDAPSVQYVSTTDGVSIAYAVVGAGMPLVLADRFSTAGIDARLRSSRSSEFYEHLVSSRRLVAFDWRNSGLSGTAPSFGVKQCVIDLEQVVNHLRLAHFDLWATIGACKAAMEFAAMNPSRVRKLILSHPTPAGSSPRTYYGESVLQLLSSDWQSFTELFALRNYGWTDVARDFMEQLQRNWTQETFQSFMSAVESYDASASASKLQCETLVLADEEGRPIDVKEARRLAAVIPRGRLALIHLGGSLANAYNPQVARLGNDFLNAEGPADESADPNLFGEDSDHLSAREIEVLRLVAAGKSNAQIAAELLISQNTVIRHVSHIFEKIGVANRTEASVYARDHGMT